MPTQIPASLKQEGGIYGQARLDPGAYTALSEVTVSVLRPASPGVFFSSSVVRFLPGQPFVLLLVL